MVEFEVTRWMQPGKLFYSPETRNLPTLEELEQLWRFSLWRLVTSNRTPPPHLPAIMIMIHNSENMFPFPFYSNYSMDNITEHYISIFYSKLVYLEYEYISRAILHRKSKHQFQFERNWKWYRNMNIVGCRIK